MFSDLFCRICTCHLFVRRRLYRLGIARQILNGFALIDARNWKARQEASQRTSHLKVISETSRSSSCKTSYEYIQHPSPTPSAHILHFISLCQLYMCICRDHPTVNVREKRRSRLIGKSVHLSSRTPGTEEDPLCLATKNNPQQATVVERP